MSGGLVIEFACHYLHIHDFDTIEEKSQKYYPEFADLRSDMYEESILFFTDLFQRDASLLSLLDADHTFVNQQLAEFYGIEGIRVRDGIASGNASETRSRRHPGSGDDACQTIGSLPHQSDPEGQLDQ